MTGGFGYFDSDGGTRWLEQRVGADFTRADACRRAAGRRRWRWWRLAALLPLLLNRLQSAQRVVEQGDCCVQRHALEQRAHQALVLLAHSNSCAKPLCWQGYSLLLRSGC